MKKPKPTKRLSLEEAARRCAEITEKHLNKLSPDERAARIKAFQAVVSEVASSVSADDPAYIDTRSLEAPDIPPYRVVRHISK